MRSLRRRSLASSVAIEVGAPKWRPEPTAVQGRVRDLAATSVELWGGMVRTVKADVRHDLR